mmetsp:Transcript_42569/g.106448  ORF Transcript_42569/g.106448 Transcript_42569/m.106448 type:complete len:362 (+) Transcript_42569:102-1187(+)
MGNRVSPPMVVRLVVLLAWMAGAAEALLPLPSAHASLRGTGMRQASSPALLGKGSMPWLGDRSFGSGRGVCEGLRLDGVPRSRSPSQCASMSLLSSGGHKAKSLLVTKASAAAAAAHVAPTGLQLFLTKFFGYGILAGSFGLQVPQIFKIVASKSVIGISRASRYSEVPINSSACIYHMLKKLPFSTWGENAVVLTQNIVIVALVWIFNEERVTKREMVGVTAAFLALCIIQFSLPPILYPLLIYINVPLGIASNLPQIITNFQQKHTGQVATLSNFLKFLGCFIRIFTTLSLIGIDWGLLVNYGIGATTNIIIVAQGFLYSEETKRVLALERSKKLGVSPQAAKEEEDARAPDPVAGSGA